MALVPTGPEIPLDGRDSVTECSKALKLSISYSLWSHWYRLGRALHATLASTTRDLASLFTALQPRQQRNSETNSHVSWS